VPAKVNAWVDQAIAPVVEALSVFPEVETFSSCEGDGHVFFHVRGPAQRAFSFTDELASSLSAEIDACCEFKLALEWRGGNAIRCALYVQAGAVDIVSEGLRAVSDARSSPSARGTAGTGTRS